jgi:hypothetical protein
MLNLNNMFEEYIKAIKTFHESAANITVSKAKDYAGIDEPMRNFIDSALIAGTTVEQGILVRMADKLARARNLTEKGSLDGDVGEKLEDTLKDLSNYAAILAYYTNYNYNDDISKQLNLPFNPIIDSAKAQATTETEKVPEEKNLSKLIKDLFLK